MNVSGKKAVVFGGTSGIGLATVEKLVAGGASVVAVSRSASKASALPAGATFEACDVTDGDAVAALLSKLAPYDILISAATGGGRVATDSAGDAPGRAMARSARTEIATATLPAAK